MKTSLRRGIPWIGPALAMLASLSIAPTDATTAGEPKKVALQALTGALVKIVFTGSITLTGETQSLVYTQPLPADDEGQDIVSVEVDPSPNLVHEVIEQKEGRIARLKWTGLPEGKVPYRIAVTVRRNPQPSIQQSSKGSDEAMLESGTLTKPTAGIKKIAKDLAAGSGSDLETALRIAVWIHENIEYDLAYSQDKKDKTVAKVIEAKRGTCDELSHLFISMARSAGIPAREVSGLAFTGKLWGFHSWSEIKLGSQWVPVDATNLEVGQVDALHVAFARDGDDAKFEQQMQSLGTGTLSVEAHSMDVKIVKASLGKPVIEATLTVDPQSVPPSMPFTAKLAVTNSTAGWLAGPARLIVPEGMPVEGPRILQFVAGPKGKATVEWKLCAPADLATGMVAWYGLGAILYPHHIASSKVTVAAGVIDAVDALKEPSGNASVAVTVKNQGTEAATAKVQVCLYKGLEPEGDGTCSTGEVEVAAGGQAKLDLATDHAVEGDFCMVVKASIGSLSDELLHRVKVTPP